MRHMFWCSIDEHQLHISSLLSNIFDGKCRIYVPGNDNTVVRRKLLKTPMLAKLMLKRIFALRWANLRGKKAQRTQTLRTVQHGAWLVTGLTPGGDIRFHPTAGP